MQKVRCHSKNELQLIVSIKFQDLFQFYKINSISPFPHGTYSLSIIKNFRLEGGPPIFKEHMTCIPLLLFFNILLDYILTYTGLLPSLALLKS